MFYHVLWFCSCIDMFFTSVINITYFFVNVVINQPVNQSIFIYIKQTHRRKKAMKTTKKEQIIAKNLLTLLTFNF